MAQAFTPSMFPSQLLGKYPGSHRPPRGGWERSGSRAGRDSFLWLELVAIPPQHSGVDVDDEPPARGVTRTAADRSGVGRASGGARSIPRLSTQPLPVQLEDADDVRTAWEQRSGPTFDPWADMVSIVGTLLNIRRRRESNMAMWTSKRPSRARSTLSP